MPNTDTRRVREDYWYTSAQITDFGRAWQRGNPERLFLHSDRERPNRTAFEAINVPGWNDLPKKILLPLNKGNSHWTAIAIDIRQGADHRVNVNIWFTDSLSNDKVLGNQDPLVRQEIARIERIFRESYDLRQLTMRAAVYPYTWYQPDGSSCGPYLLANGARCLDNRGQEANPGRKRIREQQLDMMVNKTGINCCSTNNEIDEILLDWIIDRAQNNESLNIITPEDVRGICEQYARKHHRNLREIEQIFHDEYCFGTLNPQFRPNQVNMRVREIIGELGIQSTNYAERQVPKHPIPAEYNEEDFSDLSIEELLAIYQLNEPVQHVAAKTAEENISQRIDGLRNLAAKTAEENISQKIDGLRNLAAKIAEENISLRIDDLRKNLSEVLGNVHEITWTFH